jgi:glutamyl-tRNA synthetase
MDPDEGPYRQSERGERYAQIIEEMWEDGQLYACDCTRDDVLARTKDNQIPGYDGFCRDRGIARSERTALRFRTPGEGSTVVHDIVRGDVEFPHSALEDFVLVKSSGQPLFVLANVIDDRDTAISHVIRGEDLLPSTPKGILVWRALDEREPIELPAFAHLPMLVNEQRKKLSKRRDRVAVESYRDQGFVAEAFRNYLALLGWSPSGDREKVDVDTLVEEFRLEDVHHGPAFFDVKKLTHLNGEYIREMSTSKFVDAAMPWVHPEPSDGSWVPADVSVPWPPERFDPDRFTAIAPAIQSRVTVLGEVPAMVDFLFLDEPAFEDAAWAKIAADPTAVATLGRALEVYSECEWTVEAIGSTTRALAEEAGSQKRGQAPIRLAITGRSVGPPLFESLEILGRTEVLRRIRRALERLPEG